MQVKLQQGLYRAVFETQDRFGKKVTYVTSDGKTIESSRIKKDSKVRVHYIKEGNDMLVDKVIVTERD